ncbi:hypothetical protein [Sinorhizobium fredii]|uniref:hypothetical protein n=1 Tax=Rhizobium fredii TaxID=380 RepID=UPI00210B797D|nr:hypothetical protein [Sinorhizobium fredii]
MPKYVVAEQVNGPGCYCFQAVEGYHEIAFFCQDWGTSIIAHCRKSKDACGCRINLQVDRNATLQKELERLSHKTSSIHVMKRLAIMAVRLAKGQRSTFTTQELYETATYPTQFYNATLYRGDC